MVVGKKEFFGTYHDVSALRGVHGHGETMGKSQKGKDADSVESVHFDGYLAERNCEDSARIDLLYFSRWILQFSLVVIAHHNRWTVVALFLRF